MRRSPSRRVVSAFAGALLAITASVALAQGPKGESEESEGEGSFDSKACVSVGCNNGNRVCGAMSTSDWMWIWTPYFPIPIRYTRSWTCYETIPY